MSNIIEQVHIEEIHIEYDIKGDLTLYDITQALAGINGEYRRKIRQESGLKTPPDLIVTQMSKASPFRARLVAGAVATQLMLWGGKYVTVHEAFDFVAKDIGAIISGKADTKNSEAELDDIDKMLRPVYKNEGSKFILFGTDNSKTTNLIEVGWDKANIAHSQILQKKKNLQLPDMTGLQKEVLLYIDIAVNKTAENVGDKGVIESISPKQLKLYFPEDKPEIKAKVLTDPFGQAYIVTVDVLKVHNNPVGYKIIELHDTIPRE